MLTADQCRELVSALRLWKGAAACLVKGDHIGAADLKAMRIANASTDGLLSRLAGAIKELEGAKR